MAVRNASCTLIDCSSSSATSAVSTELVVLGDVVRCLPRLIALVAQATELLNVVVILSKADRLDDDSAAPSCYSGSRFGELQDLLDSASLVSGSGLSHAPSTGIAARHGSVDPWDKVTRAFLTFAWHVGHLWWPSQRKFWRFGWQNGMGPAQNSRVFRDAPTVVDFHR